MAVVVLLSGAFARDAIRDAATYERIPEAHLIRPAAYVLMSPVSSVLDTLTLLSLGQHIALALTIIAGYAIWWWLIGRASLALVPPGRRAVREVARIGVGLVMLAGVYVIAAILPRPMAKLDTSPDVVTVDFHSHTRFSHDGRPDWTAEDVRAWHAAAGFDVAYVSDHRSFEGARDGWANNPALGASGTVLIPAIEAGLSGEHVNVLDADRLYKGLLTSSLSDVDTSALRLASLLPNNEPVIIETLPGNPLRLASASGPGTAGIRAIEIVDGSPRGLWQTRRQHDVIVHLADSANLALVAGSDHHGWGHAAAGWTMMYAPRWRGASPDLLAVQLSRIIRGGGNRSTRVAERYIANTEGALLPLTVPLVTWGMLRSLDADERIVWIIWLTLLYALLRLRAVWRTPRTPAVE